jgi:SPP1 gp7 family putative phage head morphogenesis protein
MVNSIAQLGLMQETLFELYKSPAVNDVELAMQDAMKRIELKALQFDGSDYTKRQLNEARNAIASELDIAYKNLFPDLQAESAAVATTIYNSYAGLVSINKTISKAVLEEIISSNQNILGYTFKELVNVTKDDHERAIRVALASGVADGSSTAKIVRNIKDANTRNVKQLNTNVYTILKQSRENATYSAYAEMEKLDFIDGYTSIGVLDGRTSEICRNLDNVTIYKPVRELPGYFLTPRHFSCRSKLAPHIEDSEDVPFRSSIEGQVANQSYGQWFKTQSPAFQKSVLGNKKYNLYKQGRYTIGVLADAKGKSLSLNQIDDVLSSEIKEKYDYSINPIKSTSRKKALENFIPYADKVPQIKLENDILDGLSIGYSDILDNYKNIGKVKEFKRDNKIMMAFQGNALYVKKDYQKFLFNEASLIEEIKGVKTFNSETFKKWKESKKTLSASIRDSIKTPSVAWYGRNDFEVSRLTAQHESWHKIDLDNNLTKTFVEKTKGISDEDIAKVSYYALIGGKKELFAEVGALYSSGRKDIIPTNILDIFEDTIKGLKNAN